MHLQPTAVRVLNAFRVAGTAGLVTAELLQPDLGGGRFGARIGELREIGCVFEKQRESRTSTRYWLVHEPDQVTEAFPRHRNATTVACDAVLETQTLPPPATAAAGNPVGVAL